MIEHHCYAKARSQQGIHREPRREPLGERSTCCESSPTWPSVRIWNDARKAEDTILVAHWSDKCSMAVGFDAGLVQIELLEETVLNLSSSLIIHPTKVLKI